LNSSNLLTQFYATRDQYRSNADLAVAKAEYCKASELLWGALTQQIKALAAKYNITIGKHGEFFDFMRQIAEELNDQALYTEFVHLNALHRNFYDEMIPPDVFPEYYERAVTLIDRLATLVGTVS